MGLVKRYTFQPRISAGLASQLNTNFDDIIGAFNAHQHTNIGADAPGITVSGLAPQTRVSDLRLSADGVDALMTNQLGNYVQFGASAANFGRGTGMVPKDYVAGSNAFLKWIFYPAVAGTTGTFTYYVASHTQSDVAANTWNIYSASTYPSASYTLNQNYVARVPIAASNLTAGNTFFCAVKPTGHANVVYITNMWLEYAGT
jgi:hypothetical protein